MVQRHLFNHYLARTAGVLSGARRGAMMLIATLLFTLTAQTAWAAQEGNWTYTDYSTYSIINAYTGSDKTTLTSLTFPKQLGGEEVMGVAWNFHFSDFTNLQTLNLYRNAQIDEMPSVKDCSKLAHINELDPNGSTYKENSLPGTIRTIQNYCFQGTAIESIEMTTVTSVGSYIFRNCNSLSSVNLGNSVTIADFAFSNISSSCVIYNTERSRSAWSGLKIAYSPNLYVQCSDGVIGWCGGSSDSAQDYLYWSIDDSRNLTIASIDNDWSSCHPDKQLITSHCWNDWATANSKPITSITLSQVYALGAEEFKGLTGVESVTLNDGLTSIGASAFEGCTSLTSITIPASVTSIGADAFKGCTALTTVTIEGTPTIADGAFPSTATVRMTLTANGPVDGAYWTTFYNKNYNFEADANTQVFKAELVGTKITLHEVANRVVDAGEGVVLKTTGGGNPEMTLTTSASGDSQNNSLAGVSAPAGVTADGTMYVLNNGSNGVGFYKLTAGKTLGVGKAYLTYTGTLAPGFFGFDEGTTGITNTDFTDSTDKVGAWYTLSGVRLNAKPTQKGLYIVNGKKIMIK